MEGPDPTWLSLLPALVTIFLAFATRQVLVALFAGVLMGSGVLLLQGSGVADANPITRFLLPAIGSKGYAKILLIYLWCLGGLIGMPYEHAYNGSKSAMHRIIDGLRVELKPRGITFTSVFPSFLEGRMISGNAFLVKKSTPMEVAGRRIVDAAVQRRVQLKFPWFDSVKVFVMGLLPQRLRDAVAPAVMETDFSP